jgi:hypothetical protein
MASADDALPNTTPPKRPPTPAPDAPRKPATRLRTSQEKRLYVQLKGTRRKLFGNVYKCHKCKQDVETQLAIEVVPVGASPANAVHMCHRCAVCSECWTMRPLRDGRQETYAMDATGRVTHARCMRCNECGQIDGSKEPTMWSAGMTHRDCLRAVRDMTALSIGK